MKIKSTKILLIIILSISVFFRFWQLKESPPGLYPDEAINGNNAIETLQNNDYKLFYADNNGREGLFIWLISTSFYFFGASPLSLRIPSAIIGTLTVFGLFLLAKELFSNNKNAKIIALLSSFFLSISFWHVNFSRISFRAILIPFFLVFSFYLLLKSFRKRKISDAVMAGVFFGLGFYSYPGFRLAVLLLLFSLFIFWLKEKKQINFFKLLTINLLSIFITAIPIGLYFLKNIQDFLGRSSQVSIFSGPNILKEFFQSLILHLGMFNLWGDGNWRHNIPRSPELYWIVGLFFLIGFILSIKKIIINIKEKKVPVPELIITAWFFIMLLPGVLTKEGSPHALRVIGVIPVVYIFAGIGALFTYQQLLKKGYNKKIIKTVSITTLLLLSVFQFNKYFVSWASNKETKGAFSEYYVEIGNYLNSLPDDINKVVIVNFYNGPKPWPKGIPISAQTTIFIEKTKGNESSYFLSKDINKIDIKKETIIVPIDKNNKKTFQTLEERFPSGKIINKNNVLIFKI